MANVLKGWLADNTVTTDNKDDKILVLESAGSLTEKDILERMMHEITGLKEETLNHAGPSTTGSLWKASSMATPSTRGCSTLRLRFRG